MQTAVFLDRDGVLVEDMHLLTRRELVRLLPGVPAALEGLSRAGFKLLVISNQTVVARGLASEEEVHQLQAHIEKAIQAAGGPSLDGFYFCPHHPKATLPRYRIICDCRKPRSALLRQAAMEHGIDLGTSFMVGDRITDVMAGQAAGCRTVQVQTGKHLEAPIQTSDEIHAQLQPTHVCADIAAAARWILQQA